MKRRIISAVSAALLLLSLTAGCAERNENNRPELREPAGMDPDIVQVERGTISRIETYEGLVLPEVRKLSFAEGGVIAQINICVGSQVKAGDILLTLDSSYTASQLETALENYEYDTKERELTQKKKELSLQIASLELDELKAAGASRSALRLKELELQALENEFEEWTALNEIDRAEQEKTIAALYARMEASVLRAPCDGTVVYLSATDGGYASATIPLVWIADSAERHITTDYITADAVSKANEIYALVDGKRVEVEYLPMSRADYLAMLASDEGRKSRFILKNANGNPVEDGMNVILFVISDRVEDTLILPSTAVRRDSTGFFVYVLENGASVRRGITRGVYTDALTEIRGGVEEGERIYAGN